MLTFMQMFNSELEQFEWSLRPRFNPGMLFKAGEGAGRSGSFFFFTKDQKFIIKTMSSDELSLYLKELPKFTGYFKSRESLIARIYGVFTIKLKYMDEEKKYHMMLM